MINRIFLFFVMVFSSISTFASSDQLGNWWMYFGNHKIADRWNIHNEVQYRNYEFGDLDQLLLRGGIAYDMKPGNHNVLIGYAYIHSEPYNFSGEKYVTKEYRPFAQYIFKGKHKKLNHTHRGRFEYRDRNNTHEVTRLRYFLSLSYPLWEHQSKTNMLYATAYNELFIHLQKNNSFDRNRVFGGLGYQLNKDLKFELGYMSQILNKQATHQITVGFYNNISFYKKNK